MKRGICSQILLMDMMQESKLFIWLFFHGCSVFALPFAHKSQILFWTVPLTFALTHPHLFCFGSSKLEERDQERKPPACFVEVKSERRGSLLIAQAFTSSPSPLQPES